MALFGQFAESPGQWMITGQLLIAIGTQHQHLPFRKFLGQELQKDLLTPRVLRF